MSPGRQMKPLDREELLAWAHTASPEDPLALLSGRETFDRFVRDRLQQFDRTVPPPDTTARRALLERLGALRRSLGLTQLRSGEPPPHRDGVP